MIHWLSQAFSTYVLHVEHNNGYQWWSGAGSDLTELALLGAVVTHFRHHNCHHKGCWRLGHAHPKHGWPACKHHWNETPEHVSGRS